MPTFKLGFAALVLATALSTAAYAAKPAGGGGHGGGGGGAHAGGGGGHAVSDEQKARFEAIGPQRTAQAETLEVAPTETHRYRRGIPNPEQIIRRLLGPL